MFKKKSKFAVPAPEKTLEEIQKEFNQLSYQLGLTEFELADMRTRFNAACDAASERAKVFKNQMKALGEAGRKLHDKQQKVQQGAVSVTPSKNT